MSRKADPDSLATVATLFAGPGSASNSTPSVSLTWDGIYQENVGFRFVLDRTVQTLSSTGIPESGSLSGLLFVPDLAPQDSCNNLTEPFIPSNVTRHKDVSNFGYPVIGLAPWVSPDCTQSFLAASREIGIKALVFFQPSNNESGIPPPPTDARWKLDDGDHWRSDNTYPIYAIPGPAGTTLMHELAWFSDGTKGRGRNEGSHSVEKRDNTDRLFTMIDNDTQTSSNPSLWSFVLAILGTIVGLSLIMFVIYKVVNHRRREALRQRINAGEVDIEQLALNQIKVPREVVDEMPTYTYPGPRPSSSISVDKEQAVPTVEELGSSNTSPSLRGQETPEKTTDTTGIRMPKPAVINLGNNETAVCTNPYRLSHTQTTCAICIDDFVVGSSIVRELPCGHIFDPGCIDPYLMETSSLCPLCKKSVMPPGSLQIPVTNAMVRQEQMQRQSR
ncbi:hypothetical protein N7462_007366 [Penicillium macrosclerotiorum]|uniref:uncharacterized protein n=1 Tax=Penicillium macrosclerotiorum TaxID=303699 RepID=UPI002546E5CF|nr:uncharacterized protein N7462_007366 [Penicillium macrosclerotiorum]KAJ5679122.1 hypothetical protein N7462_007366 [Penicillium macrosclerotiorum]